MSDTTNAGITIGRRFQGPTGSGQGGWCAARLAEWIGRPVMVWFRQPVPLDTELIVEESDTGWRCRDGKRLVMQATPWVPDIPDTGAVTIEQATAARGRFPFGERDHPGPDCFSCGIGADGMQVHVGPLGEEEDGGAERFATDWTAPRWATGTDGTVDPGVLWAALDCASGLYVNAHPRVQFAVTASFAVDALRPVEGGETLALVAWPGDGDPDWNGRKRAAASAAFDADGALVARSRSFWIALDRPPVGSA